MVGFRSTPPRHRSLCGSAFSRRRMCLSARRDAGVMAVRTVARLSPAPCPEVAPQRRRSSSVVHDRLRGTRMLRRLGPRQAGLRPLPTMAQVSRPRAAEHGRPVAILVPGADAIANAGDPVSVILGWARGLGFDGVTYFAGGRCPLGPRPAASWSTWDERWQQVYRDSGYASVDPRLVATAGQSLPCLWDGGMIVARGRLRRFLDDAARVGVRSGVAIPIGTARGRADRRVRLVDRPVDAAEAGARSASGWASCSGSRTRVHASRHGDRRSRAPARRRAPGSRCRRASRLPRDGGARSHQPATSR